MFRVHVLIIRRSKLRYTASGIITPIGNIMQRSTECTSVAGHSSQHNITQHGMLPQYPTGTAKLM